MARPSGHILATCCGLLSRMVKGILGILVGVTSALTQSQHASTDEKGNITFIPGLRLQPRYEYDAAHNKNDFLIQRFRLKGSGNVFDVARYGAELKVDNVGRFEKDAKAEFENAWLDFQVVPDMGLRVGLYDIPFSRNALTSDSKLLLMDRSLIKDALTALGLADNTIGLLAHGRPFGGHFEYAAGIFDNVPYEKTGTSGTKESDHLMPGARIAVDLLDPAKQGGYADYQASYIAKGQRLSIGANAAFLPKAHEGVNEFNLLGMGADLFFNSEILTLEAEYDRFTKDAIGPSANLTGAGWYVQGGYLVQPAFEIALRYQELDPDKSISGDRVRWISGGLNIYLREHNLKIQSHYTFKKEETLEVRNDLFQVQLQLDF